MVVFLRTHACIYQKYSRCYPHDQMYTPTPFNISYNHNHTIGTHYTAGHIRHTNSYAYYEVLRYTAKCNESSVSPGLYQYTLASSQRILPQPVYYLGHEIICYKETILDDRSSVANNKHLTPKLINSEQQLLYIHRLTNILYTHDSNSIQGACLRLCTCKGSHRSKNFAGRRCRPEQLSAVHDAV